MNTPQSGIFDDASTVHHYLEYRLAENVELDLVKSSIARAISKFNDVVSCVIAFSRDACERLIDEGDRPGFAAFTAINGAPGYCVPATQSDILIWLHGRSLDQVFDHVTRVHQAITPIATPELDLRGFNYRDSRDLTGFIDGSANPKGAAIQAAACIADGQPGAGGSIVFGQKWVHDLQKFNQLSVTEQERVIGRTKADSIELEGDAMPLDSHVSRTDVKIDGVAAKIYRRSAPYGTALEHGLYFLAFACEQQRIQVQLDRMFGVSGDGRHDRLVEYSRPVSGSYWFAPTNEVLQASLSG